jgi:hypothetical protein
VAELARGDDQRHASAGDLDGVAELVMREATAQPAAAAVRHRSVRAAALVVQTVRRAVDDAEQRTNRELAPQASQGSSCSHPHASIATSRRRPPVPRRTNSEPRRRSRSASVSASASRMRSPASHKTTIRPRSRWPCGSSPASRITAMISSTFGGSAGYRRPLLPGGRPAWNPGIVAGERRRPARSSNTSDMTPAWGWNEPRIGQSAAPLRRQGVVCRTDAFDPKRR